MRRGLPLSAPSFDELLVRLVRAEVRFVVIGGLALGSWGVVRGTKGCDIVPDPEPDNLEKLAALAAELGGHVQLGESLLRSKQSIAALLRQGTCGRRGHRRSNCRDLLTRASARHEASCRQATRPRRPR